MGSFNNGVASKIWQVPKVKGEPMISADSDNPVAEGLAEAVVAALKTVYDPEIPVDIYELGLVYRADVDDEGVVSIDMTLTAPACPVAEVMPGWVEEAVAGVPGVSRAEVSLVFDPPWDLSRMSEVARVALNMF
jgi:FeS assembly SUF system protein